MKYGAVAEQLDHQPMHERSSPPRADRARDWSGEREARKRGDDNIVPVCCERLQEPLEFEIRTRPAVEKQDGRLGASTFT